MLVNSVIMISTITSSDEIINKEKKSNSIISTPISDRPITTASRAYCYVYTTLLCSMLSFMHLSQLLLYPLSFIPGGLREFYWWYIRKSKESFGGRLMIFLGGKTKLELTFNQSINLNDLVDKDENGNLILKFDRRAGKYSFNSFNFFVYFFSQLPFFFLLPFLYIEIEEL